MNCKEANLIIAGLIGDELPSELETHVRHCAACADLLAADSKIRTTLRSAEHLPSPYVLGRIRQEIALPVRNSWLERLKGNKLMKIGIPSAAVLALALALLPRPVDAATPKAAFAKMKTAVLAKAKQRTSLEIKVGQKPDGTVGGWVVLDGELTELPMNTTLRLDKDGKQISVSTAMTTSEDTSSLPPEVQAAIKKAIEEAKANGGASQTTTYSINGKEVDAATANRILQEHGIDLKISVDLDETHYRAISFGSDQNHLILSPKSASDRRYVVTLDPKSNLPKSVQLQKNNKGTWVALKQSNVVLR